MNISASHSFRNRWFGPLLLTITLLAVLVGLALLLEKREQRGIEAQLDSAGLLAARGLRLNTATDLDFLKVLADGMARGMIDIPRFQRRVADFVAVSPELEWVRWIDADGQAQWVAPQTAADPQLFVSLPEVAETLQQVRRSGEASFSRPYLSVDKVPSMVLVVPVRLEDRLIGLFIGYYDLRALMRQAISPDIRDPYHLCLEDRQNAGVRVCEGDEPSGSTLQKTLPVSFLGDGVQLQLSPQSQPVNWDVRIALMAAVALALGLGWVMWALQQDIVLRRRTEADLSRHLNLLQTIMSATPDSVFVKDAHGHYRLINRVGAQFLGRMAHEVLGKVDAELIDEGLAQSNTAVDKKVMQKGRALTREEELVVSGQKRYLLTTRTPYWNDEGELAGLVGISRDITDQKASQRTLQRSEERFRSIFESSALGIATLDLEGRLMAVNPSFCAFLGYAENELIGVSFIQLTAREDQLLSRRAVEQVQEAGQGVVRLEKRYRRKDGRNVWGNLVASLVCDHGGQPLYWVAMVEDIDASKAAEETLRQSEERYRLLFSAGSDAILVYRRDNGRVIEVNSACEALFGLSQQRLETMSVGELLAGSTAEKGQEILLARASTSQAPRIDFKRADGTEFPAEITVGAFDLQGQSLAAAILRDITERQKLEELKDEMLSSVSHEMRTPLTAMLGFAEFMLDNDTTEEQRREYLHIIQHETSRLKELIDNLLNLQRLRAGFGLQERGPVSLKVLLGDLVTFFRPNHPKHVFSLDCPKSLPTLWGDESQLHRALRNLVNNAIKYSPEGGRIELGARQEEDALLVWVSDEGLGIPEASLDRIFERFYRIGSNGHQRIGGTGLGLPLVREIVRRHQGQVWAESCYGKGSTFYVKFALNEASPAQTLPEQQNQP